jgi:DNA-binding transcriptional regulator YiaG
MTAIQFSAAIARLGLSQVGTARLFNANDRTVRRWISGDRTVPDAVGVILRLLIANKITIEDVESARCDRRLHSSATKPKAS